MNVGSSAEGTNSARGGAVAASSSTYDLFLSFASEHEARVALFREHAKDRLSLLSFNDRPLSAMNDGGWKYYAEHLIRSCGATLCLIGPSTYQSRPVDWEIRKSVDLGKPVLAVYLEPTTLLPAALVEIGVSPLPLSVDAVMDQLK